LSSSDAEERCAAARALPLTGRGAAACALDVSALLRDEALEVRVAAVEALGTLRAFALGGELRQCLRSSEPLVAEAGCRAIGCWGEDGQAFASELVACLARGRAVVAAAAARALVAVGGAGLRHGEAVAGLLSDTDVDARMAAVEYFAAAGSLACTGAAARVAEGLAASTAGPAARAASATALGYMQAGQHAESVAKLLGSSSEADTTAAFWAAGVQPKPPATLRRPACAAAVALGRMGKEGAAHAEAVAALLDEEQVEVVAAAVQGLGLMGARDYAERLVELVEDRSPSIRAAACQALGDLSSQLDNSIGLDHVSIRLADPHPGVREAAVAAIGKVKLEGSRYLDDVVGVFDDKAGVVQAAAVRAVGGLGSRGELYLARVARVAAQGTLAGRLAAIEVLGASALAQDFADDLLELVADPQPEVRVAALRALARAGADAQVAIGQVLEARDDAEPAVRFAAEECAVALGA